MASCVNTNDSEFQTLVKKSGLHSLIVESYAMDTLEKYGRYPHLDELPEADSEPYLREFLKVSDKNSAKINDILEATGSNSLEESVISLNNEYEDVQVRVLPLKEKAIVNIQHMPTETNLDEDTVEFSNTNPNSTIFLNQALEDLKSLYGISIIPVTVAELSSKEWADKVIDAKHSKAFVYEGNIYLNTDVATLDSPVHEMMHLFLGSMRYTNPDLYQQLVSQSEQFKNYEQIGKLYPNRTRMDLNEEVFVSEFSKYLVGEKSELQNMDESTRHEIFYNVNRIMDIVLMGKDSTKTLPKSELINMSLKTIAQKVRSSALNSTFQGTLDDAAIHRVQANIKSDLMKNNELKEYCV